MIEGSVNALPFVDRKWLWNGLHAALVPWYSSVASTVARTCARGESIITLRQWDEFQNFIKPGEFRHEKYSMPMAVNVYIWEVNKVLTWRRHVFLRFLPSCQDHHVIN